MDFVSLPTECLAHVFRFISFDQLVLCTGLSRKMRDAALIALLDTRIIYYGRHSSEEQLNLTLPFLTASELKKYRKTERNQVMVKQVLYEQGRFINANFFTFLKIRCPNLEAIITIYYIQPSDLSKLSSNLRYLHCKFDQSSENEIAKVMKQMVHLESLVHPTLQLCPFKLLRAKLPLKYILGPCGVVCSDCDLGPCNELIPRNLKAIFWRMEEWTIRSQSIVDVNFRNSLVSLEMEIENEDVNFDFKFPKLRNLKLNFFTDTSGAWKQLSSDLPVCTQLEKFYIQVRLIPPEMLDLLINAIYLLENLHECTIIGTIHEGEEDDAALYAFNNLIAVLSSRKKLTKLKLSIPVECDTVDYSVAIATLASLPKLSYIEFNSGCHENAESNCLSFLSNLNPDDGPKSIHFEFSSNIFSLPIMSTPIHDRLVNLLSSGRLNNFSTNFRCACDNPICILKVRVRS